MPAIRSTKTIVPPQGSPRGSVANSSESAAKSLKPRAPRNPAGIHLTSAGRRSSNRAAPYDKRGLNFCFLYATFRQRFGCQFAGQRRDFSLEPRPAPQPGVVSPGGMRQRKQVRAQMDLGGAETDDFLKRGAHRQRAAKARAMIVLRRSADRENRFEPGGQAEQLVMPGRTAFASRRQIGAFGVAARVAKTHGRDRDARRIVELLTGKAYPAAQAVAGGIVERRSGGVDPRSRRLASDQQASAGRNLQNRPWFVRQRGAERPFDAKAAGADARDQRVEVLGCGQGQAEALGRAATAARQRAKCGRSSGKTIRAGRAKSAATIAVISAMEKASPAR